MSAPTYIDFAPLYDFTKIEAGVQDFFTKADGSIFVTPPDNSDPTRESWTPDVGSIAFFTAFQNQLYTKARPRVSALLSNFQPFSKRKHVDANDQLQIEWWQGKLTLLIVTKPDYKFHMELRATVLALAVQMALPSGDGQAFPVGINNYLEFHEVTGCEPTDISSGLHIDQGYYLSPLQFLFDFAVRPDKWPGE